MELTPDQLEQLRLSADRLFETITVTDEDLHGTLKEGLPLVFARIAQKPIRSAKGKEIVKAGDIYFFSTGDTVDFLSPRSGNPNDPNPFLAIFIGGTKNRIFWGPGKRTPQKGVQPMCKSLDGIQGIPSEDLTLQTTECARCPFNLNRTCDETRVFLCALKLQPEEAELVGISHYPILLQFTKSAIAPLQKFLLWLQGQGSRSFAGLIGKKNQRICWHFLETRVSTEFIDLKGGYFIPQIEVSQFVSPDMMDEIHALRGDTLKRMLPAASTQTVYDQLAADYDQETHSYDPPDGF